MVDISGKYAHCPPRQKPRYEASEETIKNISSKCRVIPLYEKGVYEHIRRKHYSLQRNEYLKCAWSEYKKDVETRVVAPFQFPDRRDYHFYKGSVQLVPSQSDYKRANYRKSLKPGPGVDLYGQLPILHESKVKPNYTPGKNVDRKKKMS